MTAKLVQLPTNAAPSHLGPEAQRWYLGILNEYRITDPAGLMLLQAACEAFDTSQKARAQVAEDGLMSKGSKRQARAHPLLAVERDARAAMLASLKALNLDLEPLRDAPGRPPGLLKGADRNAK